MAYLFDTDAISELLRPRPLTTYVEWLSDVPREEQFTSAVVIGELYKGAYRAHARQKHLNNIEQRILPAVTALPYDVATAKVFGQSLKRRVLSCRMLIYKSLPPLFTTVWNWSAEI